MKPVRVRTILLLAPAFFAGTIAVAAASALDASALRLALQAAAVASFLAMAWRVGAMNASEKEPGIVALAPAQAAAIASDRRRPTFDRESGLCANWYFRLRVEEEIARSARYGQPFTVMSLIGATHAALDVPRLSLKHWLRQVDFAGDLGSAIAIVLPNTDRAGAAFVMERLTRLVAGIEVRIAEYPVDGATLSQLLGDDEWRVSDGQEGVA